MSSSSYSTCLTPDPWLRIIVLTSGRLLLALGLVLLLTLDIAASIRAAACLLWMLLGGLELKRIERGFENVHAIRISSDGEISVLTEEREWLSASLQSGSVVLKNLAWLRLRLVNGDGVAELLRGDARQSQDWRRLQVIWRHIGAAS